MDDSRIASLQRTPMFGAINDETLGFLLERAHPVECPAGRYFFREGDAGNSAYLLEEGSVAVLKSWQQVEHPLRQLGPGDCFGEVSLLDLGRRSASVRAEEAACALEFDASALLAVRNFDVEQFALIYMNLGRELGRRLREADDRLFRARFEAFVAKAEDGFGSHSL